MSLSKSRKIICFLLSIIMVIGAGLFTGVELISHTLCSQAYMEKVFLSDKIKGEYEENYKKRISILAKDSMIPERVFFTADENALGKNESAVSKFFNGHDSTLYSKDRVETYEKLCLEYLDGNEIEYNKEDVHNVAEKAAMIYSDSFGLKNTDEIKAFIDKTEFLAPKIASFGLFIFTMCAVIIFFLFSKKIDAMEVYCSVGTATGFFFVLTGIAALIFGLGNNPMITPLIYADAVSLAIKGDFIITIIIGIFLCIISILGSIGIYKRRRDKKV